ncbi:hypothetical protein RHS02_07129, partial [Rhizoctonia solani]
MTFARLLNTTDAPYEPKDMSMSSCPSELGPDFCTVITPNADISGKGVRIALYSQTLLTMAVASFIPYHEKAFHSTARNAYIVSTSLIIASLIEMKTRGLSLFDASIVTMLTTIMTAFVTINSTYMRQLGLLISICSFLFTTFWCYWGLRVWEDPSAFGIPSDRENCTTSTGTIFVVFGHNVSVTNRNLRGFALSMFATGIISALESLCYSTGWLARYTINGAAVSKDNAARRYVKRLRLTKGKHMSHFGGLAGMIYMIVTMEQIVDRNGVRDELNNWTYSQTLALIMIGQQLLDCITYVKEEIKYRREERERNKKTQDEIEMQRLEVRARTSVV